MGSGSTNLDAVTVAALLGIASFAIDRTVRTLLFVLSYLKSWSAAVPDPLFLKDDSERIRAEKRQKVVYVLLATLFSMPILFLLGFKGILYALGFKKPALDFLLTLLVLVAGSDRIGEFVKMGGSPSAGPEKSAAPAIEIKGRVVLEEATFKRVTDQNP